MKMNGLIAHVRGAAAKALASVVCLVAAVAAALPAAAGLVIRSRPADVVSTVRSPVKVTTLANGHTLVDFGKDAAGYVQFDAKGAGAYEMIIGEALDISGGVNNTIHSGMYNCWYTYVMNKEDRSVECSLRAVTLSGSVSEAGTFRVPMTLPWQKRFDGNAHVKTNTGDEVCPFRYIEVVSLPSGVSAEDLRQVMYHYPFNYNDSSFTSSDANLNQVYDLCKWSLYADSYLGYWLDGDRERQFYQADAYVSILDSLGVFSDMTMNQRTAKEFFLDEWKHEWSVEWYLYTFLAAFQDYWHSGDISTLQTYYDKIKPTSTNGKYYKIPSQYQLENGLLASPKVGWESSIVDWPRMYRYDYDMGTAGQNNSDNDDGRLMPIENALLCQQYRDLATTATALGKTADAAEWSAMATKIYNAYQEVFFDASCGLYRDKAKTDGYRSTKHSIQANAAALAFGMVPADKVATVANFVANEGMKCGTYMAHLVLEGLGRAGRTDAAIAYMASTAENSWMNMINEGLTTCCETWSIASGNGTVGGTPDVNHPWSCAPASIISRYVLGVRPAAAGWAKATVAPQFGTLTRVSGKVPTAKGSVEVEYKNKTLTVTVPTGMAADVTFVGVTKTVAAKASTRTVTIGGGEPQPETKPWAGKKVSILGDSYSSYQGSAGSSNCYYYPEDYGTLPKAEYIKIPQSGMWWAQVIDRFGGALAVNSSVGGSPMTDCYTEQNFYQRVSSQTNLLGSPDVIFVFGGMNDHWMPGNKLTDEKFDAGIKTLFDYLKTNYASAKVYVILNKEHTGTSWTQWGITTGQRSVLADQAASHGFSTIDLQGYFSTENDDLNQGSYPHATAQGQTKIANRVISVIEAGGDEPVPTHKHTLGPWQLKTPPTCTEAGVSNRVCTAEGCDRSAGWEVTAVAPKLGHDFRDDWVVDQDDATKEVRFCHRDGCTASERRAIPEPTPVTGEELVRIGGFETFPEAYGALAENVSKKTPDWLETVAASDSAYPWTCKSGQGWINRGTMYRPKGSNFWTGRDLNGDFCVVLVGSANLKQTVSVPAAGTYRFSYVCRNNETAKPSGYTVTLACGGETKTIASETVTSTDVAELTFDVELTQGDWLLTVATENANGYGILFDDFSLKAVGGDTPTPQPAETPLTVSDQASWTAWMQGVDTEEKLAAVKAAVSGKAAVKIAIANFEAGHDDFQVSQMTAMAAYYGLAVEIKQVEPTNPDAGRTLDVVYRDAVEEGDIVIDFKSYWTQDECDRAAAVIANCPEKLFILPYGEAGSPVPPTSQSLQGRARHADGSGLANMLLTIPIVKGTYGSLTGVLRRTADDTATAAFVSASGWAGNLGDTCQSASMAAIAAAWITAARGDAPSAAEIVRLLEAGRGLPSATDQESVAFTAANRESLAAKIAEYATADAQGRKKLLNDAPLNLGGVLRQLPEEHVHSWGAWTTTVAATCEGYGYKTRTCSAAGCADREQRQTLLPLGHEWGEWMDDPSNPSRQIRSCVRAGCTATEARFFHAVGDAGWGWQKTVTEGTAKYEVLVFTNVADQWSFVLPEGVTNIDYVVVAGGGGGGAGNNYSTKRGGGGGGAGGLLHGTQPGTGRLIVSVGKGGAAGKNGFDSTLAFGGVELTAVGGGAGASDNYAGYAGGSGGGGGGKGGGAGGDGVAGQGNKGGSAGGGGGGYASPGVDRKGGAGGAGYEDPFTGLVLAKGGAGGTDGPTDTPETQYHDGLPGAPSTGNGGDGAYGLDMNFTGPTRVAGAGGSGVVIVRYQVPGGGDDPHVDPEHPIVPLELSKIFQSNMVIQRDRLVRVWGKGPMGETVTVSFAGQTATSAAIGEDDLWEVAFARPFAANPEGQQLKVTCSDGATITLDDVLVGDVWIAAGQSNMVMPVKGSAYGDTYDADETVADMANHPQIRWMAMDIDRDNAPTAEPYEVKGGAWGKAAKNLSAVAYHFAHDCVTAHPEIPVGIIGCYCNALSISYWTPGGTKTLWNCQLAPITRFAVRGAIWYQGETDANGTEIRDHRWYGRDLLKPMVAAWRSEFGVEAADFPFYFVQLAGTGNSSTADDPSGDNDNGYRAARESMLWARRNIENCGMVVAWDCGRRMLDSEVGTTRIDEIVVHPRCKSVLGQRLARLALRNVYGDNIVAESPYWTETETDGIGNIRVKFDMNGSAGFTTALKNWDDAAWPVKTTGEALKGFAVAGSDKVWHWANAVIESADTIRLSSPDVAKPLYVRYCYRNNPVGGIANGYNEEMLPIAPIATEYSWYADVRKEGIPDPSLVVLPTATPNLKYNGETQTGVAAGTGYTISGNTGKDAKSYTASTTLSDGYKWADGSADKTRTIPWSIAKGTNKWTVNPSVSPATWKADSAPSTITFANGANTFGAEVTCDTTETELKALTAGQSKTVTFTAAADGDNYDAITHQVTVKVTASQGDDPVTGEELLTDGGFEWYADKFTGGHQWLAGMNGAWQAWSKNAWSCPYGVWVSRKGQSYWTKGEGMNGSVCCVLQVKEQAVWLRQTVTGLAAGTYRVTFLYQRRNGSELTQRFTVSLVGASETIAVGSEVTVADDALHAFSEDVTLTAGDWTLRVDSPAETEDVSTLFDDFSLKAVGGDTPPAHKHVLGPWTLETPPTCEQAGVSNRVCTADGCTNPVYSETAPAPALGHDFRDDWAVDPDDATKEVRFCHRDGCTASERRVIPLPVTGEDWGYSNKVNIAGTDYMVVVFTNTSETLIWPLPAGVTNIDYLVVGGGGAGGTYWGGGGGAGGVVTGSIETVVGSLEVAVGAGGAVMPPIIPSGSPRTGNVGGRGGDSVIAIGGQEMARGFGGGGGGGYNVTRANVPEGYDYDDIMARMVGGSNGGGSTCNTSVSPTKGTFSSAVLNGWVGGNAGAGQQNYRNVGGGGGAGAAGKQASNKDSGGSGICSTITGEEVWYAGGGAGDYDIDTSVISGGLGGGGYAGKTIPDGCTRSGTDGLGGGGGGGRGYGNGYAGGSGVVIIRYALGGGEPEQPEIDPSTGGGVTVKAASAAEAIAKVTVVTPDGVTNPEYATYFELVAASAGEGTWLVTAELKADAVRPEIADAAGEPAFVVGGADVTVRIVNAKAGLYYGCKVAVTLDDLAAAVPQGVVRATETGPLELSQMKPDGSGFYRPVVSAAP